MQQVKNGVAKHGTAYFAHEQTAGKGQRNKHWLSVKDQNIILSIVIETNELLLSQQFTLSIIAALSARDLFNNYATKNFKIKWPNDLYWQDRKTGGILIENIINGDNWKFAIVGFGLNINQTVFDPSLKNPFSLKQVTGKEYNVIELSKQLCSILQIRFNQLINGNVNELLNEYNEGLYKKNEMVRFKKDAAIFERRVIKADKMGRLIVENSYEEAFEFGSVEWIIE